MVSRSVFCTGSVPAARRFDAWTDSVSLLFDVDPAARHRTADFHGRVESVMIDGLVFNRCQSRAQPFDRSVSRFAADGLDHYMIQLFLKGGVEMSRGQRVVTASRGSIVGFDLGDGLASVNEDFDLYSVFVPRRRLAPLLRRPDSLQGAIVSTDGGAGALLADYMHSLYRCAAGLSDEETVESAEVLLRLMAMTFNATPLDGRDPPEWAEHAVLLKARAAIGAGAGDPELSPERIAAEIGVSRTRLYLAFQSTGGVMGAVRDVRLRRCFADLVSPSQAHLQIASIGYRHGFRDPAHFTRTFKARFGLAPGEARAGCRMVRPLSGAAAAYGLDRSLEAWIAAIG